MILTRSACLQSEESRKAQMWDVPGQWAFPPHGNSKKNWGGWEETLVGRPSAGPEMGATENIWVSEISRLAILVLVVVR